MNVVTSWEDPFSGRLAYTHPTSHENHNLTSSELAWIQEEQLKLVPFFQRYSDKAVDAIAHSDQKAITENELVTTFRIFYHDPENSNTLFSTDFEANDRMVVIPENEDSAPPVLNTLFSVYTKDQLRSAFKIEADNLGLKADRFRIVLPVASRVMEKWITKAECPIHAVGLVRADKVLNDPFANISHYRN